MAISGLFTTIGIAKSIDAQNNEGYKILVEKFAVSDVQSSLSPAITTPNGGTWYTGVISSRIAINQNTIRIICVIPQNQSLINKEIKEIYLLAKDSNDDDFLLAVGQTTTEEIIYNPTGTVTLELQIQLVDINLTANYLFASTIAPEINSHNTDPNAHLEYVKELRHAGIKVDAGPFNTDYEGVAYDKRAHFDGVQSSGIIAGVTFTADYEGPDGDSISLVFDGVKTVDEVRSAWNIANPDNTVSHDGAGTEVPSAGTLNLTGGLLNVSNMDVVYKDTDGKYKRALAVAGIQSKVSGFAYLSEHCVKPLGFHKYVHSFTIGSDLFLSATSAGQLTTSPTSVKLGIVQSTNTILTGIGLVNAGQISGYDAVVTDDDGVNYYTTTQAAIDAVGTGARIFVNKLEELVSTLTTSGKRLEFVFNGLKTGWKRYAGSAEIQTISFSSVPDSGTWRIVFGMGLETSDLAFNANAAAIQAAINLVFPLNTCVVTGNYTSGFTITFSQLAPVGQPYFTDAGINEVQRVAFGNIPDNGTLSLNFNGQNTANLAWNDNSTDLKNYLEALSNLDSVNVTGSFSGGFFDVEFTGADGNKNQPQMTVNSNSLNLGGSATSVNITTPTQGRLPASNLKTGLTAVVITSNTVVDGSSIGDNLAIIVGADKTQFLGLGTLQNYGQGIDFNGFINSKIQLNFVSVTQPFINTSITPNRDYDTSGSIGLLRKRIRKVGTAGDHLDLVSAITAANNGDIIEVYQDQAITTNLVINKEVEILFFNQAKLNVTSLIAGVLVSLGTNVKTKDLRLYINSASAFTTGIQFSGILGHHKNIGIEFGAAATITNAFRIDASCSKQFMDGYIVKNAATITNKIVDAASIKNNNFDFRDDAGLILPNLGGGLYGFNAVVGSSAQVAAGLATHTTIQAASDAAGSGGSVLILAGAGATGNLTPTVSNSIIQGQGWNSTIGALHLTGGTDFVTFKNLRFTDNVIIDNGSSKHILTDIYMDAGKTITDNNTVVDNEALVIGMEL